MSPLGRFLAYKFLSNAVLYISILLVFFQDTLGSASSAALLVACYTLATALSEVPSGLVADAVGHRLALIFGGLCASLAALMFLFGDTIALLALGQILVALAMSFRSGTESAYLYDLSGSPEQYERAEGRATAINYAALGSSSLLGGILYTVSPSLPFVLTLGLSLVGVAILLSLPDLQKSSRRPSPVQVLLKAGLNLRHTSGLLNLSGLFAVLLSSTGFIYWVFQIFLDSIAFPVAFYGVVFAGGFLASALGSAAARGLNARFGLWTCVATSAIIPLLALTLMGTVSSAWAALLLLCTQFLTGYLMPTMRLSLQTLSDPDVRATILSLSSILQRGFLTLLMLVFGMFERLSNVSTGILFVTIGLLMAIVTSLITSRGALQPGRTPKGGRLEPH